MNLSSSKNIRLVHKSEPVDITAALRADINERDWLACHVNGDKGPRINLPDKRRKWGWS